MSCVIRAASMQQSLPRQSTPQLAGVCQERLQSVSMRCAQRLLHKASQPLSRAARLPMSTIAAAAQSASAQAVEAPQPVALSLRTLEVSGASNQAYCYCHPPVLDCPAVQNSCLLNQT